MLSKLSNLNSNLALTLGYVNPALNNSAQCSTPFLYISLPLFYTTTMWNFQKLLSYTFFRENVVRVLVHFFFTAAHFHLALVAASISHFVTVATKFSLPTKKCLLFFLISRSRSLSPFFRLSFGGLPPTFSFSPSFSSSIFQTCEHDN